MVRLDTMLARQMDVAAPMPMLRGQVPVLRTVGRDMRRRMIEVVGGDLLLGVRLGDS